MDVIIKITQLVLALSLLVLVHELGHFLFARMFKIRVDKFYLFFNPTFSLLRAKRYNGKWHFSFLSSSVPKEWDEYLDVTEYGIGWLPLGGYCKIAGMIDESMDKEQLKQAPQPWEFRTKPAWQRLLVMVGGVLFNIILGFLIYAGILFTWGDTYLANEDAIYGIEATALAQEMGFRDGDKILFLDGEKVERFYDIQGMMVRNRTQTVVALREKDTVAVTISPSYLPALLKTPDVFNLAYPLTVREIPDSSQNIHSGLQAGDRVIEIDSISTPMFHNIRSALEHKKGQLISARILRGNDSLQIPLRVDEEGRIGVLTSPPDFYLSLTTEKYGLLASIPQGVKKGLNTIQDYLKDLGLIFSPKTEAYKSVGSFITIGKIFSNTWDWGRFWNITAFISIMLAVLNLLPIPALDGGHIMFVLFEMITGRKPSDKFLENAQIVGMLILLAIMVLAFGNDIYRLFN